MDQVDALSTSLGEDDMHYTTAGYAPQDDLGCVRRQERFDDADGATVC